MVQLSGATLLALASVVAAGAHHLPAHAALHRRGDEHSLSSPGLGPAPHTYTLSSPAAASETCTEEESTTPAGSKSTYVASTPAAQSTYPASSPTYHASSPAGSSTYQATSPLGQSTYPASSPAAQSTYPASSPTYTPSTSPAAESGTTCTEEESSTYPASTPAGQSTYPASTPAAQSTYPASSPVAESSYPASSPAAESSYPASSPLGGKSTSTSTYYSTSTAFYTVTGGAAPSQYPSSPAAGSGSPQGGCGTVTVTVTAGQAPPPPPHHKSKPPPPPPAQSTYEASSPAASSYQATTPQATQTYPASSPPSYPTTTPSPSQGYSGGKRGVAFASIPSLNLGSATGIKWAWNWSPSATGLPESVEFVPILKDLSQVSEFEQAAQGAPYVMAFNEVDMTASGGGAPMTPQQAAEAYQQYIMPFANKAQLGSPSVTSDNSPNSDLNGVWAASGVDYLQQFAQACQTCQIDFVQAHWYGQNGASGAEQAQLFIEYIEQFISTAHQLWGENTPIWVTEFSALPEINEDTSGVNQEFMQQVLPYLDSNPSIARYAYYAAIPELLTNADGSLTSIGQTYADA